MYFDIIIIWNRIILAGQFWQDSVKHFLNDKSKKFIFYLKSGNRSIKNSLKDTYYQSRKKGGVSPAELAKIFPGRNFIRYPSRDQKSHPVSDIIRAQTSPEREVGLIGDIRSFVTFSSNWKLPFRLRAPYYYYYLFITYTIIKFCCLIKKYYLYKNVSW